MSVLDNFTRAYANYSRLLLLTTEVIANPTQANVDALVASATTAGLLTPKPTYGIDGISYDWANYQEMITRQLKGLRVLMQEESGPFEIRSQAICE